MRMMEDGTLRNRKYRIPDNSGVVLYGYKRCAYRRACVLTANIFVGNLSQCGSDNTTFEPGIEDHGWTHVRLVVRLIPARKALIRRASKPR